MLQSVKVAFGRYMGHFYESLSPTTKGMQGFVNRGLSKSIVWAPARMVDAVEEMLASWQRNDTDDAPTQPAELPVIIAAMAKDYTPSGRDYTRQITADDGAWVIIPEDVKERAFDVKLIAGDIRTQVAIFAHDEPTAKSLASQLLLFIDAPSNRRFLAKYEFAGLEMDWPVQIESPDPMAQNIDIGTKNMTVLAIDIMLKVSIPIFGAPKEGQPNDGKGIPGDSVDPAGHPVVVQVNNKREDI
jgi:hypothetical protein